MEKIIKIGDKDVRLNNNVAWTMEYRDQFGNDVLETLMPIITSLIEATSTVLSETGKDELNVRDISEALQGRAFDITLPLMQLGFVDTFINVTWAMAKAADESIEPPKRWVRQFDEFPLDVVVPEVGGLILKGFTSSKNLTRLRTLLGDLQPRSISIPSSSPVSNED